MNSAVAQKLPPQERYQPKHFVGSSHSWAIAEAQKLPTSSRVLDVGSGSGVLGRELRERGFTRLSAVEVDPAAREFVAGIYDRIEASLTPFEENRDPQSQFDLVLLLDVLEHMTDPFSFFQSVRKLVAPGGTILLSVPNVAHITIRAALLCGFFPYAKRGILDETHYQFFTRSRIRKLITAAPEVLISSEAVSIPPLEFLVPPFVAESSAFQTLQRAHLTFANLLPGALGYQLLSVIQIPPSKGFSE